ncbi:MAG: methyltransferase domain-containing protein [Anaerolineaceae bacterium]|nr:methyltransferase domain-containing protein [Anaerolineaceae bacterium]
MMTGSLPLYADGRVYDQIFYGTADIPYWQTMVQKAAGASLELSCGTGRILLELAASGLNVSGLDLSNAMLAYAAEKAEARGLKLDLHQGDMRHFQLNKTFALIYVPNNALGHLYTREDMEAHLACVKSHLQPDGLYMLDMFVPNPALLLETANQLSPMDQYTDPTDGTLIDIYQTSRYDHATQIKHATWSYIRAGAPIREEPFSIRMFYPQELDTLLHYNGFQITAKYGDYDLSPFSSHSKYQLITARVAQ